MISANKAYTMREQTDSQEIAYVCEFWAFFAPLISETGFEGTHATVNDPKIDYSFLMQNTENCHGKVCLKMLKNYDRNFCVLIILS